MNEVYTFSKNKINKINNVQGIITFSKNIIYIYIYIYILNNQMKKKNWMEK